MPGENYSRYEFTVGAGLRRAKEERRNGGNGIGMKGGAADSGRVLRPDKASAAVGLNKLRNPSGKPST